MRRYVTLTIRATLTLQPEASVIPGPDLVEAMKFAMSMAIAVGLRQGDVLPIPGWGELRVSKPDVLIFDGSGSQCK